MDDKDRVFSRFKNDGPEASDRREMLTISRRAGTSGSRVVEVVHVRSGGALKDRPRRVDTHVRAASWDDGFPAKQAAAPGVFVAPAPAAAPAPTAHLMPAWEPAAAEETPPPPPTPRTEGQGRGRPRKARTDAPPRHVADPFDALDDGANCMRCGYAIETAREQRGLMTCSACG